MQIGYRVDTGIYIKIQLSLRVSMLRSHTELHGLKTPGAHCSENFYTSLLIYPWAENRKSAGLRGIKSSQMFLIQSFSERGVGTLETESPSFHTVLWSGQHQPLNSVKTFPIRLFVPCLLCMRHSPRVMAEKMHGRKTVLLTQWAEKAKSGSSWLALHPTPQADKAFAPRLSSSEVGAT